MMYYKEKKLPSNVASNNQRQHYENEVQEDIPAYPIERCIICGAHRESLVFKQKKICIHCLNFVKSN